MASSRSFPGPSSQDPNHDKPGGNNDPRVRHPGRPRLATLNIPTAASSAGSRGKTDGLIDRRLGLGSQHLYQLNPPINETPTPTFSNHSPHSASAPIRIPERKRRDSQPTTPLTGRDQSFFPLTFTRPFGTPPNREEERHVNEITPSPESPSRRSQRDASFRSPIRSFTMQPDRGGTSSLYTPSSPLSPIRPTQPLPTAIGRQVDTQLGNRQVRCEPGALNIPNLPPFHPANYESSSRGSRPSSSSHGRQFSDAQQKLHQYQRDVVVNASRAASRTAAISPRPRPTPPRLHPLGSPGPVTPLMLEGHSDYLLAGSGGSQEGHAIVERLINGEKDRIDHPERMERHSPAVSPAGGHG